jgi:uncharacterized alpha-E superfamily protein
MLARIAYELFWLGRSMARADHAARLLDAAANAQLEGHNGDTSAVSLSWDSLLAITGVLPPVSPVEQDAVLDLLVSDPAQPASIAASIEGARERARTVRDVISLDMWETINTFHMRICHPAMRIDLTREPSAVFDVVRERCALFWGVQRRTMLRDDGWSFLNAGSEIEAADMVVRMLVVMLRAARDGEDNDALRDGPALALLRAVGGQHAFRRATSAPPNLVPVAHFLVFHRPFPDSIAASIDGLRRALSRADPNPAECPPVLRLARLAADLDFRHSVTSGIDHLLEALAVVERELDLVDGEIINQYFAQSHRPAINSSIRRVA